MKRLHLAFPFTGLSGKFGSKQDLRYAENDNKAFYSPAGNVNYARNYQPCMVGAKVARTGLSYFTIKTKAAFKATADALRQCALMGATSAIYGISIADAAKKAQMDTIYSLAKTAGYEGTFHKFVCMYIRAALASNAATIVVSFQGSSVNLGNNPFSSADTAIAISSNLLVKFWKQLTANGIQFSVANAVGITISGNSLELLISETRLNVLSLSQQTVGYIPYVKLGNEWLKTADGEYVPVDTVPTDGQKFSLSATAPEP